MRSQGQNSKALVYSTGNASQCSIMAYVGKESQKKKKKKSICIYVTEQLCCILGKYATL